jgi:methylenetetrahydrofolate dehydrogenase (NADP+)/methenyltetrahydrofolate cyclohydrolase
MIMAKLLDGKKVSENILEKLALKLEKWPRKPTLAVVLVDGDEPSEVYVSRKEKAAAKIGVNFRLIKKPNTISQAEFEVLIEALNKNQNVDGVIVQKPLPPQIDSDEVDILLSPEKDVDGLNPISTFIPATTRGIMELLDFYKIGHKGKKIVVVGSSKLVGLPTALEFINKNAAVSICDSKTPNLGSETKQADILIVATGKPHLITANMVKKGVVVIDVGMNRIEKDGKTKLVGDVDFENVSKIASYITPVPGGVGPMTVAALLENLVDGIITS